MVAAFGADRSDTGVGKRPAAARKADALLWFRLALLASISPFSLAVHEASAATAAPASATTAANTPVAINLAPDITITVGYTPIVSVSVAPAHGTTSVVGEVVTYTPAAGFSGADNFTYQVAGDPTDFSGPPSAVVTVTVTAPVAAATPTLDPSVYGMIGAMQSTELATANQQTQNFNRHMDELHRLQHDHKQLGISINGQSSQGVRIASLASLVTQPGQQVASDGRIGSVQVPQQTAQTDDASSAVPIELPDRIGVFVNGSFALRNITGTNGRPNASPRTGAISVGIDYRLGASTIIGVGGGYTGTTADIGGGSKTTADAFNITTYGTTRPIDPVYIDWQVSYGHTAFDSMREVGGAAFAHGDPDANQVWGSLSTGYEFDVGAYTFGPYLRVDGSHSVIDGFTETGPSTITVTAGQQTVDSAHSVLGFQGDRAISMASGILSPHVRAEYLHEFIGASGASVGFSNGSATGFQVSGYPVSRNYFTLGVGASYLTANALTVFVDYDALVGYTHQTNHSITGGVSMRF
jgi:uncharacterized protein YhjY with autotransporter beta-barrel domain